MSYTEPLYSLFENPVSAQELQEFRDQIVDEAYHEAQGRLEAEEHSVEQIIGHLLAKEACFQRIFITESGSLYFVTHDDASLRFKNTARGIRKVQPVVYKQTLIDSSTAAHILERRGIVTDTALPKTPYQPGAIPFEFCTTNNAAAFYTENDDTLTILQNAPPGLGGYHVGNPINYIVR